MTKWTPQEQAAIAAAAHVDLGSGYAKQMRAFLVKKYGADVVTDELVRVMVQAKREEQQ